MRIDKFLKVSRIIKRRSLAKDVVDASRIMVNNKVVKPSYNVKVGDIVSIIFGNKIVTIKIVEIIESTKKNDAKEMYELISEEPVKQDLD
jgi:ribosomal 50S subunit-recycling heat shock protein